MRRWRRKLKNEDQARREIQNEIHSRLNLNS